MARTSPNKRAEKRAATDSVVVAVPPPRSELEFRYDASDAIRPGSHPELEEMKPGFENPITVIKRLFKKRPKKEKK